ncbi:MAG: SDR family NAD(P)-dependent oxidoreductase [Chlamydiales bacterium]|nr:SDR family NAD(P)-dependent oxidoreductase [Chlamydiales bacterium]
MKALITGATSGIGEGLAHLLASKGYRLILSGRNEERLRELGKKLDAEWVAADLAEKAGLSRLIETVEREIPDLLVNSAGYGMYGEALSIPVEKQMAILEVNAVAPIELTLRAAHALVAAKKRGVILNVSSIAGDFCSPGMGLYGPAKACLTNFSRTLNTELSPKGVHVLVSCPGMVSTRFADRAAGKHVNVRGVVMTPEFAAREIWKQIEKRQEKRTINWFYRLSVLLTPISLAKKLIWKEIQERQ